MDYLHSKYNYFATGLAWAKRNDPIDIIELAKKNIVPTVHKGYRGMIGWLVLKEVDCIFKKFPKLVKYIHIQISWGMRQFVNSEKHPEHIDEALQLLTFFCLISPAGDMLDIFEAEYGRRPFFTCTKNTLKVDDGTAF